MIPLVDDFQDSGQILNEEILSSFVYNTDEGQRKLIHDFLFPNSNDAYLFVKQIISSLQLTR